MSNTSKVIPINPAPDAAGDQEQVLYEVRKKIYPRAVSGWFAKWRWALVFITQLVFYASPWLSWNSAVSGDSRRAIEARNGGSCLAARRYVDADSLAGPRAATRQPNCTLI